MEDSEISCWFSSKRNQHKISQEVKLFNFFMYFYVLFLFEKQMYYATIKKIPPKNILK